MTLNERAHVDHPELAKNHVAPLPRISRTQLHEQLDRILDWKPHYACYGGFRWLLIRSFSHTIEAMAADMKAGTPKSRRPSRT